MSLLVLFSVPAHADMAMEAPECDLVVVSDTLPGPASGLAPLDVAPVARLTGDCDGPQDWLLQISSAEDLVFSEAIAFDFAQKEQYLRMFLDEELQADTDYTFDIVPGEGGYSEAASVGFTTGSELAGGLAGDPMIIEAEAWFYDYDTSVEIGGLFTVSPAVDADGLSLIHFVDDDGAVLATQIVGDAPITFGLPTRWADAAPTDDICFHVIQEDAAGVASSTETSCVGADEREIEEDRSGCATGGLAPSILLGLLGVVGLRRRR